MDGGSNVPGRHQPLSLLHGTWSLGRDVEESIKTRALQSRLSPSKARRVPKNHFLSQNHHQSSPLSLQSAYQTRNTFSHESALNSTSSSCPFLKTYTMLEARLDEANVFKKSIEAIKDLVQDCNFDCNDAGIGLQAMDNSHVALVSMLLSRDGFSHYRCDRNIALGINLTSLTKVLRSAGDKDCIKFKAEDAPDVLHLLFEHPESNRTAEYDLKLMDIDQEHLGIPDTEYAATIIMPSSEFKRIATDLMAMSESVNIEASKDGVKFSASGDIGNGSVSLRSNSDVENPKNSINIELNEPVSLTFSLKYLVNFCKAASLSDRVKICLSNEVPLLVQYDMLTGSHLQFYLAPKIGDEE